MSGIKMIPPPTPRSPLTTPPASPIPISTGTGACRSALVAGAFSIGGVYEAHCGRPQPLAGCRLASRLPLVCYQCTLDLMSPQPGSRMSSLHSTLPLAVPSPGDARSRLLFPAKSTDGVPPQAICRRAAPSPAPLRDLCTTPPGSGRCRPRCRVSNCGRCPAPMPLPLLLPLQGERVGVRGLPGNRPRVTQRSPLRERAGVWVAAALCTQAPGTSNPSRTPGSDRQSPPKCTPRCLKSFLEKTLTRATPPHFALQPPPTSSLA